MTGKQGGLLATLGKRMLGFSTSSSGCCAAPSAAEGVKAEEAKRPEVKPVEVKSAEAKASETVCCAPSCCESATAGAKPTA